MLPLVKSLTKEKSFGRLNTEELNFFLDIECLNLIVHVVG